MLNKNTAIALLLATIPSVGILSAGNSHLPDHKHCPVLCPINPIDPSDDCCHSLHIDIGLLYQQPYIPGMIAGIEHEEIQDGVGTDPTYYTDAADYLEQCFNYALGLTASFGYLMEHDDWFLGARFDWLSANMSNSYNVNDETTKGLYAYEEYLGTEHTGELAAALGQIEGHDAFNKIQYAANIDIYVLDVMLSRGSFHSKCFSYEPFAGVKALWFSSSQHPQFLDTEISAGILTKQHNWGAGPMFGFNGEYHFVENIALFSDSDIAVLFGDADKTISAIYQDYDGTTLDEEYKSTVYQNIHCMIYVPIRSVLGLKFSRYCLEDKHYLALKIGYDVRAVIAVQDDSRGFTMNGLYTNLVWNF